MASVPSIFPAFQPPQRLLVADIAGLSWDEQLLLTCLQGLVNREDRLSLCPYPKDLTMIFGWDHHQWSHSTKTDVLGAEKTG